MKKIIYSIIIFLMSFTTYGQTWHSFKNIDDINLIQNIKPDTTIYYNWEIGRGDFEVFEEFGAKPFDIIHSTFKNKQNSAFCKSGAKYGFLYPNSVYYIIVETKEGISIIENKEDLLKFIGNIDNIQEALLILYLADYNYFYKSKKYCAHKIKNNVIQIKVYKESNGPFSDIKASNKQFRNNNYENGKLIVYTEISYFDCIIGTQQIILKRKKSKTRFINYIY